MMSLHVCRTYLREGCSQLTQQDCGLKLVFRLVGLHLKHPQKSPTWWSAVWILMQLRGPQSIVWSPSLGGRNEGVDCNRQQKNSPELLLFNEWESKLWLANWKYTAFKLFPFLGRNAWCKRLVILCSPKSKMASNWLYYCFLWRDFWLPFSKQLANLCI